MTMDEERDQVLIFSSAERGYLIDALMVFMDQAEGKWEREQFTDLKILLQHLMRTRSDHPLDKFLGKQVTVTLDREGVNPDGTAYGSNEVIRGQLLGIGEGGNFEILEDDGMIYHCWPALEIRERDEIQGVQELPDLREEAAEEENATGGALHVLPLLHMQTERIHPAKADEKMRDDEVRISPHGRADLSKIRKQPHEWYLGTEDPDGTIILVPAVLVPARRIATDPRKESSEKEIPVD